MQNEIILESKLTAHQKTHVAMVIGLPVVIVGVTVLNDHLSIYGMKQWSLVIPKLLFLFSILLLGIFSLFLKSGVLKVNNDLYLGTYIFGKLIFKKKIIITQKSKVAVLRLSKRQKMAWFSVASPDQSLSYHKNDVTLLNDKHTHKELLISLNDEVLANKVITFLEENFGFIHEVYSPDFS